LGVLNELSEATRSVSDPEQILPIALTILGQHLGASRCAFAHANLRSTLASYYAVCPIKTVMYLHQKTL